MLARRLLAAAAAVVASGIAPVPHAAAAATKCVALVVDFTQAGGAVSTSCVTVRTSASGSDVLQAGHHSVTFDPRYGNDFVCAIDGTPANGCHGVDNTHYWAYYHRAPGSSTWQISQEGAGTYQPANASTEGWVWDDGHTSPPEPRNVAYRTICPRQPATSPSPSPTPDPASPRTARAAGAATTTAAARAAPPSTAAPTARTTTTTSATPATTPPTVTASASPGASPSTTAPTLRTAGSVPGHAAGPPIGLIVGICSAGALATAAALRLRRSRG